ncbi:MAG: hypothetical protein ABI224_00705, partial [Acetobacteraceae bacterium]
MVNAASGAVTLRAAYTDPISLVDTGARVGTTLRVDVPDDTSLPPGGTCDLTLAVDGTLRPGEYASTLRVLADDGEPLAIPVTIGVSASPLLGIACMLLGLIVVGLLGTLSGSGAVQTRLHDALRDRAAIHEWLERNPAPASRLGETEAMDRDYDAAIRALAAPRAFAIEDHRIADADAHLAAATATAADLRRALSNTRPGALEVKDLKAEWEALRTEFADLAAPVTVPIADLDSLLARMTAFQARFRAFTLLLPVRVLSDNLAVQVQRVALADAAGQGAQAQALAITTRAWMRRAAAFLRERVRLVAQYRLTAGAMVATDLWIRAQATRPDLPADELAPVLAMLDQARQMMGPEATVATERDARKIIDDADVALLRLSSTVLKHRVDAALAAENGATGLGEVQTVLDELTASLASNPHPSIEQKKAGLTRVLAAWQRRIAAQPKQDDIEDVASHLAATEQAVKHAVTAADMRATGPSYRALTNAWVAYGLRRQNRAMAAVNGSYCREQQQRTARELDGTQEAIELANPQPALARWEGEMDAIRIDLNAVATDQDNVAADCLDRLTAVSGRENHLSREVFAVTLADTDIPAQARLDAAEHSGVEQAIAIAQRLKEEPRPLAIAIQTSDPDRVTGHSIGFALPNLPAAWGPGVMIAVDFGDHSALLRASAEALNQGLRVEHTYSVPQTARVRAVATEVSHEAGPPLGEGIVSLFIAPSPITAARALSDIFLNTRFALALLVAGTIYYWRFHT